MDSLFAWAAEHIYLWRPFAIALLSLFVLGCAWYALAAWEGSK